MYGAIEVHSMGEKGCIASNKTLGENIGLSAGRAANIISELAKAEWIEVSMDGNNHRTLITPLMTINKTVKTPSQSSEPTLNKSVNISNNRSNNERTAGAAATERELLGNLNEVTGRTFRTLPPTAKKTLKHFSVAEIRQALDALAADAWHQPKLKELSSDYLIRLTTIEKFFVDGVNGVTSLDQQFEGKTGTKSAALDKLKDMS